MSLSRRRSSRSPGEPGIETILPLPLIVLTPMGLPLAPEPLFESGGGDGVEGVGSVRFSQLLGFVSFLSRRPTSLPLPQLTLSRRLSRASRTSLPAPPPIQSLPSPPFRRLGSSLPAIVSSPAPPRTASTSSATLSFSPFWPSSACPFRETLTGSLRGE